MTFPAFADKARSGAITKSDLAGLAHIGVRAAEGYLHRVGDRPAAATASVAFTAATQRHVEATERALASRERTENGGAEGS